MLRLCIVGLLGLVADRALAADCGPPRSGRCTAQATGAVPTDCPTATETMPCAVVTVRKSDDQVTEHIGHGGQTFIIRSPSGIGGAEIHQESWPDRVCLRLHLRGLERLAIGTGSVTLEASVSSHSGHTRMLRVSGHHQDKTVDRGDCFWTEIRAFDANGHPAEGLPGEGGYFEIVLPQAMFRGKPKSLTIEWIDFYRN